MEKGDIFFVRATRLTPSGAFLKAADGSEVFMPKTERLGRISLGEEYLVWIYEDEFSNNLFASEKINNYIVEKVEQDHFEEGQELKGIVYEFSPLGAKVAIQKKYLGLIYQNEIFRELNTGEEIDVFIKKIREDGKIDLSLQQGGYRNFIDDTTDIIISKLESSGGKLYLSDKSSPEQIYLQLGISKKRFKESIGKLYKDKIIDISDSQISLTNYK